MNKFKGYKRQFTHVSKAWYGKAELQNNKDLVDEIYIGLYSDEGCEGEFSISWEMPKTSTVSIFISLNVFSDSWGILSAFQDVLELLDKIGSNPSPNQIRELLVSCGIEDATKHDSPIDSLWSINPPNESGLWYCRRIGQNRIFVITVDDVELPWPNWEGVEWIKER